MFFFVSIVKRLKCFFDPIHIAFYLLFSFMIILCITFLPNGKAHAIQADFRTAIKPTPVTDKFTDFMFAAKMITLLTDSSLEASGRFKFSFLF